MRMLKKIGKARDFPIKLRTLSRGIIRGYALSMADYKLLNTFNLMLVQKKSN